MKRRPEYREPTILLIPARPLDYNEQCAATGGRSYTLAKREPQAPAKAAEGEAHV